MIFTAQSTSGNVCLSSQMLRFGANLAKATKYATATAGGLMGGILLHDSFVYLSEIPSKLNLMNSCELSHPILYNLLETYSNYNKLPIIDCKLSTADFDSIFEGERFVLLSGIVVTALSYLGLHMAEQGLRNLANKISRYSTS